MESIITNLESLDMTLDQIKTLLGMYMGMYLDVTEEEFIHGAKACHNSMVIAAGMLGDLIDRAQLYKDEAYDAAREQRSQLTKEAAALARIAV